MNSTDETTISPPSLSGDFAGSDKHCVFRCDRSWYSLPAVSVREITMAPDLVKVPGCDRVLAGLCHLRSEFIPVISLSRLLNVEATQNSDTGGTLMVIDGSSVWAMLIAEAAALESLETLVAPDNRMDEMKLTPVMGTAMYHDKIVRVLDPHNMFRMAQQSLEGRWRGTDKINSPFSL